MRRPLRAEACNHRRLPGREAFSFLGGVDIFSQIAEPNCPPAMSVVRTKFMGAGFLGSRKINAVSRQGSEGRTDEHRT